MTRPSDLDADALLESARTYLEHSSGRRELVLASLERRLAEQGAGAMGGRGSGWAKLVSVGVLTGVTGFLLGRSHLLEPAPVVSTAPVVAVDERPFPPASPTAAPATSNGPVAVLEEQPTPASSNAKAPRVDSRRDLSSARRSLARAHPKPVEALRSVPTSAEEVTGHIDLLEALTRVRRAESERVEGRLGDALATLDELERVAPTELLREERLLERTLVECDLGNQKEAANAARELARHNPNSIYLRRLEGSCATP